MIFKTHGVVAKLRENKIKVTKDKSNKIKKSNTNKSKLLKL